MKEKKQFLRLKLVMKINLYLDCDGVILDTIPAIDKALQKVGYTYKGQSKNEPFMKDFLKNKFNWEEEIELIPILDDSVNKIKKLDKEDIFNIKILTHVISDKEAKAKEKLFAELLPNIEVITVPKEIKKTEMVEVKNSILVDDFLPNVVDFNSEGGIGIKFAGKETSDDVIRITDLLELIDFVKRWELLRKN